MAASSPWQHVHMQQLMWRRPPHDSAATGTQDVRKMVAEDNLYVKGTCSLDLLNGIYKDHDSRCSCFFEIQKGLYRCSYISKKGSSSLS